MLKLRFKHNKSNAVWLVEPKVTIGSASGNDLVIEDPKVAARHAEVLVKHEKLTLVNTAGQSLLVNEKPVEGSVELNINDQLQIGNAQLEVIDPKQEARTPRTASASETTGWALKSNHAALANRVFPIKNETVIGRSKECDVTLGAAHLSRRHVKLAVENGLLYARDLGSANGTFLNGERITEARVRRGDELRFDTLSFGVIGPPSEDLDKTSIRPISALKPKPERNNSAPAESRSAEPAQAQRPATSAAHRPTRVGGELAGGDDGSTKGKVAWALALLLAIALAAGFAWQQGLISS